MLIEDDEEIRGMITDYLSENLKCCPFNDGTTAIRTNISYSYEYSLPLLIFMPGHEWHGDYQVHQTGHQYSYHHHYCK